MPRCPARFGTAPRLRVRQQAYRPGARVLPVLRIGAQQLHRFADGGRRSAPEGLSSFASRFFSMTPVRQSRDDGAGRFDSIGDALEVQPAHSRGQMHGTGLADQRKALELIEIDRSRAAVRRAVHGHRKIGGLLRQNVRGGGCCRALNRTSHIAHVCSHLAQRTCMAAPNTGFEAGRERGLAVGGHRDRPLGRVGAAPRALLTLGA